MSRYILDEERIHPRIREWIHNLNRDIVDEVQQLIQAHDIVVIGMKWNPFPRKARKMLDQHDISYHYQEYGSYLSMWRKRNALKMWTGWSTFPQVWVKGALIGGFKELARLIESGELQTILQQDYPATFA